MIRKAREFYEGVVRTIEARPDWRIGDEGRSLERARGTAQNMVGLMRDAQIFVLSDEVAELMFSRTRLPFPVMWVERSTPRTGETHGALDRAAA